MLTCYLLRSVKFHTEYLNFCRYASYTKPSIINASGRAAETCSSPPKRPANIRLSTSLNTLDPPPLKGNTRSANVKVASSQLPKSTSTSCNSIRGSGSGGGQRKSPQNPSIVTATGAKKVQYPAYTSTSASASTSSLLTGKAKEFRTMNNARSNPNIGQTTTGLSAVKLQDVSRDSRAATRPSSSSSFSSVASMAQFTAALTSSSKRFPLFCNQSRNQGHNSNNTTSNSSSSNNNHSKYGKSICWEKNTCSQIHAAISVKRMRSIRTI